jgi:SAM-dependent methyltransferase
VNERTSPPASLGVGFLAWFRNQTHRCGLLAAVQETISILWRFSCDSTPERRRQRYGDIDYDWEHRVDTTSATVSWRDRLLGQLNSPYQPTDPALFHEIVAKLEIDFRQFVFVDIGCGKGRVLLMAADYPFRRVIGIELLPDLYRVAEENIRKYKSQSQHCFSIETICGDARDFVFPAEPLVLYLFNPLPEAGLDLLLANLERSLTEKLRPVFVLYHNPELEHVLARARWLRKLGGTYQYSIFAAGLAKLTTSSVMQRQRVQSRN